MPFCVRDFVKMADDRIAPQGDDDEMLLAALDRLASEHAARSPVPADPDRASRNACFVCGQSNPGYLSTNKHPKDAPPVLVCGVACEGRYLRAKGLYAARAPKPKKRKARSLQEKGSKSQRVPRTFGGSLAAPFGHDLLSGVAAGSSASSISVSKVTAARARPASGFYGV